MTTDFAFETVDIPARTGGPGRPPAPNPFVAKVAELLDADGVPRREAVSFAVADDVDSDAVAVILRQLARAGAANSVSVFKSAEGTADGGTRVTFWAIPRIVPTRKPKEEAPADADAAV